MRNRRVPLWILAVILSACGGQHESRSTTVDGVTFEVTAKSSEWKSQHNSTFVFVDLRIVNDTNATVDVDVSGIVAEIVDTRSVGTYYDSLGSIDTGVEQIPVGERKFGLYFVFSDRIKDGSEAELEIVEFGVTDP